MSQSKSLQIRRRKQRGKKRIANLAEQEKKARNEKPKSAAPAA